MTSEVRDNSHSTGYTIGYTYDHNANRLTKTLNSVTDTYSYDSANKLTGITGSVTKSYGYDNNGNCTSIAVGGGMSPPTTTLTYDYENRVTGISYPSSATNSFQYNGNDLRVQKVDSSGTHNYITDGDTPASDVLEDGSAVYTPGLSEKRGGTSAFYHPDAIGSTRDITNSSQSVTDTRRFDAFGMLMSTSGSNPTPFGFVGGSQYQTDADSGLMLLGHRYYDASIGRFISRDPAYAGDNWYAYCGDNPVTMEDPSGLAYSSGSPILLCRIIIAIVDIISAGSGTPATPPSMSPKPPTVEAPTPEAPGGPPPGTGPEPPPADPEVSAPRAISIGPEVGPGPGPNTNPGWGGPIGNPTRGNGPRIIRGPAGGYRSSGGGANAVVTIGLGFGTLAEGGDVVIKYKDRIKEAYGGVDDPSPGGDPSAGGDFNPRRALRGGLFAP